MSDHPTARALFPRRLKEARLAAGLTQEALGLKAKLSIEVAKTRVNRYERGSSEPSEATAKDLADALAIPLAALYAETPAMAQIIEAAAQLPARDQKKLAEELAGRVAEMRSSRQRKVE